MSLKDVLTSRIGEIFENINLPEQPAGLYDPIRYTLQSGGKRLRPTLLLAAVAAFGADLEKAKNQCVGIELFHNFTLIHDDVMDNSDVRRGQMTVHRRWNANTAILSGDAMLTLATQYMSRCDSSVLPRVLDVFNRVALEVYEGQQLDMDFEREQTVSVREYLHMITLKTSVLLGGALKIGAILAGADEASSEALYRYGIDLGIGFQLQDDYLDTFGDPLIFGKALGGDILNEKKTWLMITAKAEDPSGRLNEALTGSLNEDDKVRVVTEVYRDLGLDKRIRRLITEYSEKALSHLADLKITAESREFFEELARRMADRMH